MNRLPASFVLEFDVRGQPVPQGSLVRSPSGGLYQSKNVKDWRTDIRSAAAAAMEDFGPTADAVKVTLTFRIGRPRSHFLPANGRRPEPEQRLDAPVFPTSPPDVDKLARAALDALTSVVFVDDSQVAVLDAAKRYGYLGEGPGVRVEVRSLEVTR